MAHPFRYCFIIIHVLVLLVLEMFLPGSWFSRGKHQPLPVIDTLRAASLRLLYARQFPLCFQTHTSGFIVIGITLAKNVTNQSYEVCGRYYRNNDSGK